MRVLGLDPGLTTAGYGVVDQQRGNAVLVEFGAIRTPRVETAPRLRVLYERLTELIEQLRPDAVALERVLFNANVRTAVSVVQAAGVMLLAASRAGCEIAEYTPSEVKLAVAGYGGADKQQVQRMVAHHLRLREVPKPVDAADALALAIAHLHARKMKRLTNA